MLMLSLGGSIAIVERFQTNRFWDQINGSQTTFVILLGAMAKFLLSQPVSEAERHNTLDLILLLPYDMDIQPPSFTMWGIVVFSLVLAILSLGYYFRDTLLSYYRSLMEGVKQVNPIQTLEKTLETPPPVPAPNPNLTAASIQSEEREAEENCLC
jgi:hypothetical protein